jgi:hypothetical protein
MSRVLKTCPSCGSPMVITRLSCTHCDTEVTGSFETSVFSQLSAEDLRFVEMFVACRGNVKEMERESGLSYWTIRGKLNDIVEELKLDARKPQVDIQEARREVLAALQRAELSIQEAEEMLAQLKKGNIPGNSATPGERRD